MYGSQDTGGAQANAQTACATRRADATRATPITAPVTSSTADQVTTSNGYCRIATALCVQRHADKFATAPHNG